MTCSQLITKLENIQNSHKELNQTVNSFDDFKNSEASTKEKSQYLLDMYKARKRIRNELGEAWLFKTEEAEKLMGSENFFGPEEVNRAFGIEISPAEIPPMGFTTAELKRAEELNHFLILRVDKAPDGQPLTMEKLIKIKGNKYSDGGVFTQDSDYEKGQSFFSQKLLKTSWALVSREIIPDSDGKGYVGQIVVVIKYLQNILFKDVELPKEYQIAIDECNLELPGIIQAMENDITTAWKEASKKIAKLKILSLLRRNATEVLYDLVMVRDGKIEGKQLLGPKKDKNGKLIDLGYDWTSSLCNDNRFMGVGVTDMFDWSKTTLENPKGILIAEDVVGFHGYRPDTGHYGVCLSRQFAK